MVKEAVSQFSTADNMGLSVPSWDWWLALVKGRILLCLGPVSNYNYPQLTTLLELEQCQAPELSRMPGTKLFLELGKIPVQALVPLPLV